MGLALPSAPMDTNFTPLQAIKSRALLTLAILWNLIFPRSGLGNVSPEMTSKRSISFNPLRKSSSIFSIWVPAFRRWELTQAVNVWNRNNQNSLIWCYNNEYNSKLECKSILICFLDNTILFAQNIWKPYTFMVFYLIFGQKITVFICPGIVFY